MTYAAKSELLVDKSDTKIDTLTLNKEDDIIQEYEVQRRLEELFPPERIEAIKKKELRRYRQAQDKKWRNWIKSVSK